jgi:hypothetical protein
MEILKTTVGHHLSSWIPGNVALDIASFLVEDPEEIRRKKQYKAMVGGLYGMTQKGKKMKFDRYCKNLGYDVLGVYSYIIQLNWKNRTAKRLGRWSKTTTGHTNYAIHMLNICYGFTEIK